MSVSTLRVLITGTNSVALWIECAGSRYRALRDIRALFSLYMVAINLTALSRRSLQTAPSATHALSVRVRYKRGEMRAIGKRRIVHPFVRIVSVTR